MRPIESENMTMSIPVVRKLCYRVGIFSQCSELAATQTGLHRR